MPGFTAPKINWIKNNEIDNFKKIFKVLLPKDYLRFVLTGEFFSEMSDASGTLWLDIQKRKWSNQLLSCSFLEEKHMPDLVEGNEQTGLLKKDLSYFECEKTFYISPLKKNFLVFLVFLYMLHPLQKVSRLLNV